MTGRRLALVVAIDQYQDSHLSPLASPAADAEALAAVLADPERGQFEVERLRNVTASVIFERIEDVLADSRRADVVLLYFSCHGLKDDEGELYLAATNTLRNRLSSTAVDAVRVGQLMRRSRAGNVVLLLDCTYSGAFGMGKLDVGRGRAIISASDSTQYAFEGVQHAEGATARTSVFTAALVEGLVTGDADRDNDGRVGLAELYDYLYARIQERQPQQRPMKWEIGMWGDELYIARNPHSRIMAEHLAAPLVFLCHSSGDKERVRQLYHRLKNDNVRCWFDEEDLLPGQDWDYEIGKAIRESRYVLACLSQSSISKTGYIQKELRKALDVADEQPEGSIFLIPVRLEECQIPERLRRWHWVDLFREPEYERLLRVLKEP